MAGMDMMDPGHAPDGDSAGGALTVLFNWLGALMSVALVVGLGMWGYQLAMRDVTGVPVVRALEGPMRVQPEDPGGAQAAHQGLSVNSVAAEGGAENPADRVVLAPAPVDLTDEDLPRPKLAEVAAAARDPSQDPALRASREELQAMAETMAEGVTPLAGTVGTPQIKVIPASIPGVARSPLPRPRPIGDLTAEAVANTVALRLSRSGNPEEADPAKVPAGTRLVQLGIFDSPEAARAAWNTIEGKFSDFLIDKTRIVQKAQSGGKTFFRLRAMGFADINDARRFCSALLAQRQACIPVVVR